MELYFILSWCFVFYIMHKELFGEKDEW